MKDKRNQRAGIGMIAMPVMACVLGALIYASQTQEKPDIEQLDESLAKADRAAADTRERIDHIAQEAQAALNALRSERANRLTIERLRRKINDLEKEKSRLEQSVTKAQHKAALTDKIKELESEIMEIEREIAELKGDTSAIENRIELVGLDKFPRPYICIDCREHGVVVHVPGKEPRQKGVPLSRNEVKTLKNDAARIKGIILFVRASAFHTTYGKMLKDITSNDIIKEEDGQFEPALSMVPVLDSEDIAGHVLLGEGS